MNCGNTTFKGAVSRQSSSFCLILPITHPHLLWNLKEAKKLLENDKIRDPRHPDPDIFFIALQQGHSMTVSP